MSEKPPDPPRFLLVEFIELLTKIVRANENKSGHMDLPIIRRCLQETNDALQEAWKARDEREAAYCSRPPTWRVALRPDQFKIDQIKLAFCTDVFPPYAGDPASERLYAEAERQLLAEGFTNTSGLSWWPKWRKPKPRQSCL